MDILHLGTSKLQTEAISSCPSWLYVYYPLFRLLLPCLDYHVSFVCSNIKYTQYHVYAALATE